MRMRMTRPDAQTRAAMLATGMERLMEASCVRLETCPAENMIQGSVTEDISPERGKPCLNGRYAPVAFFFTGAAPIFAGDPFLRFPPPTMSAIVVCSKIFAAASRTAKNTSYSAR